MALISNGSFKGILIGDHCSAVINYNRDLEVKKIPRANGSIIRNTGGGIQSIAVGAWVIKDTRKDVEEYCTNIAISFGNISGDLIINDVTYSDCFFTSITPGGDDQHWNVFTLNFVRNPY